jgi:hypothetical protein
MPWRLPVGAALRIGSQSYLVDRINWNQHAQELAVTARLLDQATAQPAEDLNGQHASTEPRRAAIPDDEDAALFGERMTAESGRGPIRKRALTSDGDRVTAPTGSLDLTRIATLAYSSEDAAHPIEHLLDSGTGQGGSRWASARPDTVEELVIEFDQPQSLTRLVYEAEERDRERTQEVRIETSFDGTQTYQPVIVQEYTFSPEGATFEREDLRVNLTGVTHLRVVIVPNKRGSGTASLTSLQLFS